MRRRSGRVAGGDFDGWPAADWVDLVVLRTAGPDFYDRWRRHDVPFDDPVAVAAIRTVGEMVHTPGFLATTAAEAARTPFDVAWHDFVERGRCLMMPFWAGAPSELGVGAFSNVALIGSFDFPAIGGNYDDAVLGTALFAVAVTDRPEVRTLMAALATPAWGIGTSRFTWPQLLPANVQFDASAMANPEVAEIVSGIQDAMRADQFRVVSSADLFRLASPVVMPDRIERAYLAGMVRLFEAGSPGNLNQFAVEIAGDVETAWLNVDPPGGSHD